jgi:hypothetical protein
MTAKPPFNRIERDVMTADDILNECRSGFVPVNTRVPAAIEAHRLALASEQSLARFALRAVILAAAPSPEVERQQLGYLGGLPIEAWPSTKTSTAEQIRSETLQGRRW